MLEVFDINKIENRITDNIDAFITFCSFEERSVTLTENIPFQKITRRIILCNNENIPESEKNLTKLKEILGDTTELIYVELFKPLKLADALKAILTDVCKVSDTPHILVDITSFTHEALLILIALCQKFFSKARIEYLYVNALGYASESEKQDEKWLSRGIHEVRSVLGYAGDLKPSQETVLIVMAGYECERAWQLIDSISPSELIITYNDNSGSTDQMHGDASKIHAELLRDLAAYYQNPKEYVIASNDPFQTEQGLEKVIGDVEKDKNIILVPMNNKLSTAGAAFVALKHPEIQVCYAPAIVYNTASYSTCGNKCYMFSIE